MPVVELDRWQLTGLTFVVLLIAVGGFAVGRATAPEPTPAPSPIAPIAARATLPTAASARQRQIALAQVWPPTRGIDQSLARPIAPPLPSDPTERARAEAHMQLQAVRSLGLREEPSHAATPPGVVSALTPDPGAAPTHGGFTLQISLFDTQSAAQVIAQELERAGAAVRIRQVRTTDGRGLFRVEVGDFPTSESALSFQRRFERDTGYSGVLIAL